MRKPIDIETKSSTFVLPASRRRGPISRRRLRCHCGYAAGASVVVDSAVSKGVPSTVT
jgi:hypothetical protein